VQRNAFPEPRPRTEAEQAEARRQREERHRSQRWTPDEVAALGRIWTSWQSGERILRELTYPLLSVWGDRGRPRPTRSQLLLPENARIELVWIEGADHYVTDAPFAAQVAKAISGFIGRHEQAAARSSAAAVSHQIIFRDPARFGGWPANHGMWTWGNEILVGFSAGWHRAQDTARHQIDRNRPVESMLARSTDGGRTWSIEHPAGLQTNEKSAAAASPLRESMDFTRPGFALTLRYHEAVSFFYYSYDKGRTWHGPYRLPDFGTRGVQARTDYLIHGAREMSVFVTVLKADGRKVVRSARGPPMAASRGGASALSVRNRLVLRSCHRPLSGQTERGSPRYASRIQRVPGLMPGIHATAVKRGNPSAGR
jgi:hypothetical protein